MLTIKVAVQEILIVTGITSPMEVTYTTTIDDFIVFSEHSLKKSGIAKWHVPLVCVVILIAIFITFVVSYKTQPLVAIGVAFIGLPWVPLYPFIHHQHIKSNIRNYVHNLGEHGTIGRITLILTDETMTEKTKSVQSVARWSDMKGIEVVGDTTYIFVTGLLAAIIPRHGFERAEDYEAVQAVALTKLKRL